VDVHPEPTSGEKAEETLRNNVKSEVYYAKYGAAYYPNLVSSFLYDYQEADVQITYNLIDDSAGSGSGSGSGSFPADLAALGASKNSLLYNKALEALGKLTVTLPPSSAVAGVYAATDSARGVWKAPANVSLVYVKDLTEKITNESQEDLNVDVTAGKSINAIRAFSGRGILVWGARTLAGNDKEWRFVPVRRFFNMVEESIKKSTTWAVFEPNDANTWMKVKSMIENYLFAKWKEGALAGAKPDDAYYVKLGLGATMTAQDILDGYMNVEIGMAVVRPAEFIVLKFSHKLQQS
jgi:phage tail sheath protein FI